MPEPEASDAARQLYEALDPAFTTGDDERDWVALKLCIAICSSVLTQVYGYVVPENGGVPWEAVLNPATAEPEVLDWLAQFGGSRLAPEMDDAEKREAITEPTNFERGTLAWLEQVARRRLTGTKTLLITERYTGDPWKLQIKTIAGETPEEAATKAEIEAEAKPIGILLFFNSISTWTWKTMRETVEYNTWLKARTKAATWLILRTHE